MSSRRYTPDYDFLFKVVWIGDSGVGKTSLDRRMNGYDYNLQIISNLGVEFSVQTIDIKGKKVKTQLWDTAGQERFRSITIGYYRGAKGLLLVYDISRRETFANLDRWVNAIQEMASEDISVIVIGNKSDLQERAVPEDEGRAFAEKHGYLFMETSAKNDTNVQEAFHTLIHKIYKVQVEDKPPSPDEENLSVNKDSTLGDTGKCWPSC